jgi:hypothetical protein
MPPVEFEPTISVLERAKTVHVSDREATVIGTVPYHGTKYREMVRFMPRSLCS